MKQKTGSQLPCSAIMNANRWKFSTFSVSVGEKKEFSCSSSGGRGWGGGGWNICVHLHNRFIFIAHLRFVSSQSLEYNSGSLSWWNISPNVQTYCFPLLGCSTLVNDGRKRPRLVADWDTVCCLNLPACSFPTWFGFVGLSGIHYPIDWGQRAPACYLHTPAYAARVAIL